MSFHTGRYPTFLDSFGAYKRHAFLSEILQAEGYSTHFIGKWHMGYEVYNLPSARGFDTRCLILTVNTGS
eukprot:m.209059 g.209059  ORF g.209059 m.209059 type:complete len:70 (+) comp15811_c0_seq7:430-639(+)